jgi:hypothetical protein
MFNSSSTGRFPAMMLIPAILCAESEHVVSFPVMSKRHYCYSDIV